MNQDLSKTISFLRFPLMVFLVFYHFDISSMDVISGTTGDYPVHLPAWADAIVAFVSWICGSLCVPMFFLMSGILFFHNNDGSFRVYSHKLKKRIRSLLIPYLIWNGLYIIYLIYRHYSHALPSESINLTLVSVVSQFWDRTISPLIETDGVSLVEGAPIYAHFWYIKELLLLFILSPILFFLIKKFFYPCMVVFGLLWLIITDVPNTYQFLLMGFGGILFLLVGGGISLKGIDLFRVFDSTYWYVPFVISSVADIYFKNTLASSYIHKTTIVFGLIALFKFVAFMVSKNFFINKTLTESSFMIYALHAFFISSLMIKWSDVIMPDTWYMQLLLWMSVIGTNVLLCVSFDYFSKRYTPKLNCILTGGR